LERLPSMRDAAARIAADGTPSIMTMSAALAE
jgi:hypothetical protein